VRLRIYTISGGLVLDRRFDAGGPGGSVGNNEFNWDGKNGDGVDVASGGYVLRVEAQGSGTTQHVMRRKVGVVW
jgi:flagellar hook assembly protein FlgD